MFAFIPGLKSEVFPLTHIKALIAAEPLSLAETLKMYYNTGHKKGEVTVFECRIVPAQSRGV